MRKILLIMLALAGMAFGQADTTGTDASGGGVKLDSAARYSWSPAAPTVFTSGNILLIFNTGSANATAAGNFYLKKLTTTADYSGALSWASRNVRFVNGFVIDGTGTLAGGTSDTVTGDGMVHYGSGAGTLTGTNTVLWHFKGMDTLDIDKPAQTFSRKIAVSDTLLITNASTMSIGSSTTGTAPVLQLNVNSLINGNQGGTITAATSTTVGSGSPWNFASGAWLDGSGAWTFTAGPTAANIACSTFNSRGTGAIIIQPSASATSDSMTWYGNATFGIIQAFQWKPNASATTPHWFFMNKKNLKAGALTVGSNNASQTLNQRWSEDTITTQSMTMTSTGTDSVWMDTVQWHCTGSWALPAFSGSDKWNAGISQVWFDSSTKSTVTTNGNSFYDRYINKTSSAIDTQVDSFACNKLIYNDGIGKGVLNGLTVADSFVLAANVDSIDGISGARKWVDLTGDGKVFAYHTPDAKAATDSLKIWFKNSRLLYFGVETEFATWKASPGISLQISTPNGADTLRMHSYTAGTMDSIRITSVDTTYWDNPSGMVLVKDTLKNQWFKNPVTITSGVDSGGNYNANFGTASITMAQRWSNRQILQYDLGTDSLVLTLSGTTAGTIDSVISWVNDYTQDTARSETTTVDITVNGTYSGTKSIHYGSWYEIHVAAMSGGSIVASDSSNKIGIGLVVEIIGNSNGFGNQSGVTYTVADTHCSQWTADSGYQLLHDPLSGGGATMAPRAANWLMDSAGLPSMWIPGCTGGTTTSDSSGSLGWLYRPADHFAPTIAYGRATSRARTATDTGSVGAFFCVMGDADAGAGKSKGDFINAMNILYGRVVEDINPDSAKIFMTSPGRRLTADSGSAGSYGTMRDAIITLDSGLNVVYGATAVSFPLYDGNVHWTKAAEDSVGMCLANAFLYSENKGDFYRGPHIDSVKYQKTASSKKKVVLYKTNAGTATTPTTGYTGFEFYNGSTWSSLMDSSRADSLYFPDTAQKIRYMAAANPTVTGIIKDNTDLRMSMEPFLSMDIGGCINATIDMGADWADTTYVPHVRNGTVTGADSVTCLNVLQAGDSLVKTGANMGRFISNSRGAAVAAEDLIFVSWAGGGACNDSDTVSREIVAAPPVIDSISRNWADTTGTSHLGGLTVYGRRFGAADAVFTGGDSAGTILTQTDSSLAVSILPHHAPGACTLKVGTSAGDTAYWFPFYFRACSLMSVTPSSGDTSGGYGVVARGYSFGSNTDFEFWSGDSMWVTDSVRGDTLAYLTATAYHTADTVDVRIVPASASGDTLAVSNGWVWTAPAGLTETKLHFVEWSFGF